MASLVPGLQLPLARLDRLIEREIVRLRVRYQLALDEFRGLYVSDEQVDQLVRATRANGEVPAPPEPVETRIVAPPEPGSAWAALRDRLALDAIELDLVTLALAPEVDLKYEALYAYLNNDVRRKWPTLDLAQRLLGADAHIAAAVAVALSPAERLAEFAVLYRIDPPSAQPSLLNAGFSLAPMVTQYLLGLPLADPCFGEAVEVVPPGAADEPVPPHADATLVARLAALCRLAARDAAGGRDAAAIVLLGERGSGRRHTAHAVCRQLGLPMLRLDLAALHRTPESVAPLASALALRRMLEPAGLYLHGIHAPCGPGEPVAPDARHLLDRLLRGPPPIFAACEPATGWRELMRARRILVVGLDATDYAGRLAGWERELARAGIDLPLPDRRRLADRLPLSPGQIGDTIATARDLAVLADAPKLDVASFVTAARQHAEHTIGGLALKVERRDRWEDLVLPEATYRRVRELAAAIRNRHVVYQEWGFARRVSAGTGVKALFAGASGTGKTMTAGVIAREVGFDLYKIELSGVISKYIGETEKNLDRVFDAVRAANAMLLIDEAEAVLGKRSEVKDAHDRYANIEVAYLLQKLEEHDGVVILASNLKRNIDDAFARRMHYVIDFPLPDEAHRRRLWQGMFPREVPLGAEVDFDFLARQFDLTGGDIRNVALDAAFLAAEDGRVIAMRQLVQALARQLAKKGKVPSAAQFRQYYGLLDAATPHASVA